MLFGGSLHSKAWTCISAGHLVSPLHLGFTPDLGSEDAYGMGQSIERLGNLHRLNYGTVLPRQAQNTSAK